MIFQWRNAVEKLTHGHMCICARAADCINDPRAWLAGEGKKDTRLCLCVYI